MSLQTTQSIQFNGVSTVNGNQVATFATNISAVQTYSNVSMNVTDTATYEANKAEVRKDRDDFQDQADDLQDSLTISDSAATSDAPASGITSTAK